MNIKINNYPPLSYKQQLEVVKVYCEEYENPVLRTYSLAFELEHNLPSIKCTGKFPVQITVNNSRYHVHCKKRKTTWVFTIWSAS